MDIVSLSVTLLGFALLVTSHIAIVIGLGRRVPRLRSVAAFVLLPLAPYWALRERMGFRAAAWVFGAVLYAGGLLVQVA
jgi:hypothetical protein